MVTTNILTLWQERFKLADKSIGVLCFCQPITKYLLHYNITTCILFYLLSDFSSQMKQQYVNRRKETESIGLFLLLFIYFIMKSLTLIIDRQIVETVNRMKHVLRE